MSADEINKVINNLCDKIGIGVDNVSQLVPELQKYKMVGNGIGAGVSWLVFIVTLIICLLSVHKIKNGESYDEDLTYTGWILGGLSAIAAFVIGICFTTSLIEWYVSPNVKAIEYIAEMIGNIN